jgi:ion channel-forming bestrophin family protein
MATSLPPTSQAVTFFPKECEEQKVAVGRWMIAFVRAMRIHFQNEGDLRVDLKDVLSPAELDLLCGAQHKCAPPLPCPSLLLHLNPSLPQPPSEQLPRRNSSDLYGKEPYPAALLQHAPLVIGRCAEN